jgi:hypothetical protein
LAPSVQRGRILHFLGRIAGDELEPGAIAYYLETRKADQWIDALQTSEEARRQIGLPPLPPELNPQQRQMALAIQQSQLRLNKQHAGYWLGLAQYDLGRYETAVNWLKDRTLEAWPDGVWTGGARYNLGRTYEALGRIEDARRLYFQSRSPSATATCCERGCCGKPPPSAATRSQVIRTRIADGGGAISEALSCASHPGRGWDAAPCAALFARTPVFSRVGSRFSDLYFCALCRLRRWLARRAGLRVSTLRTGRSPGGRSRSRSPARFPGSA